MSVSQKVLVLGLGASGRTAARFYASRGFEVLAADTRPQPPKLDELQEEITNLRFLGGAVSHETVAEVSEVMISPGLSPEYSAFAPAVKEAQQRGIPVVGEIELFARELKKLKAETGYAPKIIGITGTNGKTTTTMLSTAIIAEAGKSVVAAGNVGPNALGELEKHRRAGTLPDFGFLSCRVSSWRPRKVCTATAQRCSTSPKTILTGMVRWKSTLRLKERFFPPIPFAYLTARIRVRCSPPKVSRLI